MIKRRTKSVSPEVDVCDILCIKWDSRIPSDKLEFKLYSMSEKLIFSLKMIKFSKDLLKNFGFV